jgi:glycerol-3-phosphate dehydrogenase (NAD(P)+)
MQNAAVLGAGYMGSAITFPLSDNKLNVNLWGTWLDDDLISSSAKGLHPRLGIPLPPTVKLFYWQDLKAAIDDCDIIFIGITSEGFTDIFTRVVENLNKNKSYRFFKLTKGLVEDEGSIMRASEAAERIFKKRFPEKELCMTTIGGPVRALDLSRRIPSATVYGLKNDLEALVKPLLDNFRTGYYRIFVSDDPEAVEICSTFKNIYAIAAGICDGLYRETHKGLYHNIIAFLFAQACSEISEICRLSGRPAATAAGFAGIGDLHVTSVAGRNRQYGELVGGGTDSEAAFEQMRKDGLYGEGYMALKYGVPWLLKNTGAGYSFLEKKLPLLYMLNSVIFEKKDPMIQMQQLIGSI